MFQKDFRLLAFEAAPVGLVLTEDRVIKACNKTFCNLSRYSLEDLIETSFRRFYASDAEFEGIRNVGMTAFAGRGEYSDQRLLRRADNSSVWCRFRAMTLSPSAPMARVVLSYARLNEASEGPNLSARERQVIAFLSKGLTSKAIAFELGLSPRTIEDVRARLLKKFQVRNAAEMLGKLTNIEG